MDQVLKITICAAAAGVWLAGCSTTDPDFSGTQYRCDEDAPCPSGFFCYAGRCVDPFEVADAAASPALPDASWSTVDAGRAGADSGLPALQPLVRYRIDEAATGQAPPLLLDSTALPFHLPLVYVGASPRFATAAGGRLLQFDGGGGGGLSVADSKLIDIAGARSLTIETRHSLDLLPSQEAPITCAMQEEPAAFGLVDPASADGQLRVRGASLELVDERTGETLLVRLHAEQLPCTYGRYAVVHWVIDTEAFLPEDRLRAYVDGVRHPVETDGDGLPLDLGQELVFGSQSMLTIGPALGLGTSGSFRIGYAAIHARALDEAEIAAHAAQLTSDDDGE